MGKKKDREGEEDQIHTRAPRDDQIVSNKRKINPQHFGSLALHIVNIVIQSLLIICTAFTTRQYLQPQGNKAPRLLEVSRLQGVGERPRRLVHGIGGDIKLVRSQFCVYSAIQGQARTTRSHCSCLLIPVLQLYSFVVCWVQYRQALGFVKVVVK